MSALTPPPLPPRAPSPTAAAARSPPTATASPPSVVLSRRRTLAEHLEHLVFDDDDEDDDDRGEVAGRLLPPDQRSLHQRRSRSPLAAGDRTAPTTAAAAVSPSGASLHASMSSLSLTSGGSDSASIKSGVSALDHEKAYISRRLLGVFNATKSTLEKVMPKTTAAVETNLEVVAAFEVLGPEMRANYTDSEANPEILRDATVSRENRIPDEEVEFQKQRLQFCRDSFAKFIGVSADEVNPQDIPVIAVAGSGGGFKAMIATTGYLVAMEKEGLYDCVTYLS
ncbi:hypothetical protein HK405_012411, partial [Cladochytrium tenue]